MVMVDTVRCIVPIHITVTDILTDIEARITALIRTIDSGIPGIIMQRILPITEWVTTLLVMDPSAITDERILSRFIELHMSLPLFQLVARFLSYNSPVVMGILQLHSTAVSQLVNVINNCDH
jgi:hypothetical protein